MADLLTPIAQKVAEKLRSLTPDKQQEVLDFTEFLLHKGGARSTRQTLMGALAHIDIPCSEDDIAEARREMWGNFPRQDL